MTSNIISKGAEANIIKKDNLIIKDRIPKSYRIKEIDLALRKKRTKAELKLLEKASNIINTPKPLENPDFDKISMPFLKGKKISEHLDNLKKEEQIEILKKIGESIAKLHASDIIHADLTTSNMILKDNKIWLIDFGLGFISKKIEDKAVDIHLLKQALEAKHSKNWQELFNSFLQGYRNYKENKKILERLIAVEKRRRYRH